MYFSGMSNIFKNAIKAIEFYARESLNEWMSSGTDQQKEEARKAKTQLDAAVALIKEDDEVICAHPNAHLVDDITMFCPDCDKKWKEVA
jgi:hypothetical protein